MAAKQGVIHTPDPAGTICRPSVVNLGLDQAGKLTEEQSPAAGTSALVLTPNPCQTQNDSFREPLFICDNTPSGYFGINGASRWKALIDVDSHTFGTAC